MWHAVYAAAWFAGLGRWTEAGMFFGIAILGLVVMTVLREISVDDPGLVEVLQGERPPLSHEEPSPSPSP